MDRVVSSMLVVCCALAGCDPGVEYVPDPAIPLTTIGEARANSVANDGRTLRMRGLVVLAHDKYDETSNGNVGNIYMTDPGNEPMHGMQIFAGQVRLHAYEQLQPGNLIDVQGPFVRFTGPPGFDFMGRYIDQLSFGTSIERVGFWDPPAPIELTVAEWQRNPERYVHSLIHVTDAVRATEGYEIIFSSSGRPRLDPFAAETEGGLEILVSGELYEHPGVVSGVTFDCGITGIANYFFDDFIMPRGPEDLVCPP